MGMFEWTLAPILKQLGYEKARTVALGYDHKKDAFNMTFLALNTSTYRNGVSKLHGDVSRQMFHELYPNIHIDEVPVDHVTNGVHATTWMAEEIKALVADSVGKNWVKEQVSVENFKKFRKLPNKALWDTHMALKTKLFNFARPHLKAQYERNGASTSEIVAIDDFLNPAALTIGFARRFATYKRATLLFSDLNRLDKLINNPTRPVQFVFAGKAHPADKPGQAFIEEIYKVSQMDKFKGKIVFLENYDMNIARHLVQGVDVWLNNPKRPLEASGTSGQKAAMNGVLNFSVLDGWWEEGYDGSNGWAINSDYHANDDVQYEQNAESLYSTLENQIVPLYYSSVGAGVPDAWVDHMKNSIETLTPVYNTDRMVQDYTNKFYVNTALRFTSFRDRRYRKAVETEMFKAHIQDNWHIVHVDSVVDRPGSVVPGQKRIEANVQVGPFELKNILVEAVYHQQAEDGRWTPVVVKLEHVGVKDGYLNVYAGLVPDYMAHGPHYFVRVRPVHENFGKNFEVPNIARS
jgi:starch phosphorylase